MDHIAYLIANGLVLPSRSTNTYYIMRHGKSKSNQRKVLISHPRDGVRGWGLCQEGRDQAERAILEFGELDHATKIISSDFRRAKETADIVRSVICAKRVYTNQLLRERWFGQIDRVYGVNLTKQVWAKDKEDPDHNHMGMESPHQIARRVVKLILKLERKYQHQKILLVSHGDTLAITMTLFLRTSPRHHSTIVRLKNAEIRRLMLIPLAPNFPRVQLTR